MTGHSICIPNYNYASYLGETIASALAQDADVEVHVADNASTDDSVERVRAIDDTRVSVDVNNCNVGFAGNLDRAVAGTTKDRIILLSSDDLMGPLALPTYDALLAAVGDAGPGLVLSASCHVVDGEGRVIGEIGPPEWCWTGIEPDPELSALVGMDVLRAPAKVVLSNAIAKLRNPLRFASTSFSRHLYEQVEGYRGSQLMNPDKEFHWRLLAAADEVLFVDHPLFSYRVHSTNQTNQERGSGALKRLTDQYVLSFSADPEVLEAAGVTRDDMARTFVREDIVRRCLLALTEGDVALARRTLALGKATYPTLLRKDWEGVVARVLLTLGPALAPVYRRVGETVQSRLVPERVVTQQPFGPQPIRDGRMPGRRAGRPR